MNSLGCPQKIPEEYMETFRKVPESSTNSRQRFFQWILVERVDLDKEHIAIMLRTSYESGVKWSQVESSGVKRSQVESRGVRAESSGVKWSQVESVESVESWSLLFPP
jgi:hypothetical protein